MEEFCSPHHLLNRRAETMRSQSYGAVAYKQTNYLTADPVKLIIMCYEKAIERLKSAKEYYQNGQYEAKAKAIQKAQDIISELNKALNFEKGGEIARNLDMLYKYMSKQIVGADINRDLSGLDEIIWMLEELNSAWKEISANRQRPLQSSTPILNASLNGDSHQQNSTYLRTWSV
jgi:flagellar protein FliS